jgi:hypothetical protein
MGQGAVSTMRNSALNLSLVHRQMLGKGPERRQTQPGFVCHEPQATRTFLNHMLGSHQSRWRFISSKSFSRLFSVLQSIIGTALLGGIRIINGADK